MAFDLDEFSKNNRLRCEASSGFNHALDSWSLSDWLTATAGELGEAANVIKKLNRVRDDIPGNEVTEDELRQQLADEIADTFIYLDLLAQRAGIKLSEAVPAKFDKTSAKYGYPLRLPELAKPVHPEMYKRPECRFTYCPHREYCQNGCLDPFDKKGD